ncbi:MAG: tyrosine/phenylalanine carboxypeptidase domain-containing protein [Candidatus Saccharimonadales bacterium]
MESGKVTPAIGLLQAISPDPSRADEDKLVYLELEQAAKRQKPFTQALISISIPQKECLEQQVAAHKLAEYELINTANALQRAQSVQLQRALSHRFTQASIKLFGEPDSEEVEYVLRRIIGELDGFRTNPVVDPELLEKLIAAYRNILAVSQSTSDSVFNEREADLVAEVLGDYLRVEYADALAVFDGDRLQQLTPQQVATKLRQALNILKSQDDSWSEWQVMLTRGMNLAVNAATKRIIVGRQRANLELGELKGLFGHEILVHAKRAQSGESLGKAFAYGLPGYVHAEEGLGCFVEHALTGAPPAKMYDRYLDVALALGAYDGAQRTRRELYKLARARTVVRMQAAGRNFDQQDIECQTWAHVNRIFRGTLGNDIVGVFTKDIAYYEGYQKIAAYFIQEVRSGKTVAEIWREQTCGKFDPTNTSHITYLAEALAEN